MGDRYRLVGVADAELLAGLSSAVRRGNEATAEVLAHLVEVEERMLHLDLGFPSLFAYCVQAQSMSEGAAGRRVAAARVCRRFPELFALVARGDLHLSGVCALAPHLDSANARELFEACAGKSRRQVDELLAARFPKPDVREQIRRLPVGLNSGTSDTRSRMSDGRARSRESDARAIEPLSADRYGVHFTADAELRALIERARAIASDRLPSGDLARLVKLALIQFVQREESRRFAVGGKPRKTPRNGIVQRASARGQGGTAPPGGVAPPANEREHDDGATTPPGGVAPPANEREHDDGATTPPGGVELSSDGHGQADVPTAPSDDVEHSAWSRERADSPTTPPGGVAQSADEPGAASPVTTARLAKRSRHIAASVRREVYVRDGGACSFVATDGRRCGARAFVEIDHVQPFGVGGASSVGNLRLRCWAHNQQDAQRYFGGRYVRAAIDAARRDGAPPK